MEPDEGPTDCSDESPGYDSVADHPAVFKKQRISPSFEIAEKKRCPAAKEGARDERQNSSVRYCDFSLSIFS